MLKMGNWAVGALGAAVAVSGPVAAQDDEERYGYVGTALWGEQVVDGKGAGERAGGNFMAEFDYEEGRMCYLIELEGLKDVTAAHIHKGKVGENGPPVITLQMSEDGEDVCDDADVSLMKDIAQNETEYYVNVHTKKHPKGAIRGQFGVED